MKKCIFGLLVISVLFSVFVVGAAVASAAEVPADWTLLLEETFDNTTGADVDPTTVDHTDSPYYTGNWSAKSGTAVIDTEGRVRFTTATGEYKCQLAPGSVIDTSVDADYYIMFDCTFATPSASGSLGLSLSDSTNNNSRRIFAGVNRNQTPYCHNVWVNATSLKGFSRTNTPGKVTASNGVYTAELKTAVMQLSVRQGKWATLRYRVFEPSDGETPSFAPSFWDINTTVKIANNLVYDHIYLQSPANTANQSFYDNIVIYKAPPVSAYITDAHISDAVVGKTITIDSDASLAVAGYTVVSRKWFDCENSSAILSTADNFTPTEELVGKKIKAEVVLSKGGVQTTYVPYLAYVRNPIDVSRVLVTATSSPTRDLTQWSNWIKPVTNTKITATAVINYNTSTRALGIKGVAGGIIAHYSKDGVLKGCTTVSLDKNFSGLNAVRTISVTVTYTLDHNGETSYDPETSGRNYAPGDVFKFFIWKSNVDITGGFAFDAMSPMPQITFGDQPVEVFTIPEP